MTSAELAFCDSYCRLDDRVNSILKPIAATGPLWERYRYILGNPKKFLNNIYISDNTNLYSTV